MKMICILEQPIDVVSILMFAEILRKDWVLGEIPFSLQVKQLEDFIFLQGFRMSEKKEIGMEQIHRGIRAEKGVEN
jgi:hypothetical protein